MASKYANDSVKSFRELERRFAHFLGLKTVRLASWHSMKRFNGVRVCDGSAVIAKGIQVSHRRVRPSRTSSKSSSEKSFQSGFE